MVTFQQMFKWNNIEDGGEARFLRTEPQRIAAGFRNPIGMIQEGNLSDFLTIEIKRACRRLALAERLRQSAERRLAVAMAHREAAELGSLEREEEYQAEVNGPGIEAAVEPERPAGRVVVYSEEPILASGLENVIAGAPELKLAAYCSTVAELKEQFASQSPDVAVVDLTPQITSAILFELQRLATGCKLILWTSSIEAEFALRALTIGIRGILSKTLPLEAHKECLRRVNAGALWFENVCQADCVSSRLTVHRAG